LVRKEPLSLLKQVQYRGPVWLDRVDPAALAPYGFGAELGKAVQERAEVLRQIGVAPYGADRLSALREVERRAVGAQIAARSGRAFVATTSEGLRGRVQIHTAASGLSYAAISEGTRFAVLQTATSGGALEGRQVVARNSRGELVVRRYGNRELGR
jgi:hypothetical protein